MKGARIPFVGLVLFRASKLLSEPELTRVIAFQDGSFSLRFTWRRHAKDHKRER